MAVDRFCDLVMKGGIASGVVYPRAVLELSRQYRFKNIGGTSAGAIAATLTAAAALGERRRAKEPDRNWTEQLGMRGLELAANSLCKKGFVTGLLQPAPAARAPYRLFMKLVCGGDRARTACEVALAIARMAWLPFSVIVVGLLTLAFGLAGWRGMAATLLPTLFCGTIAGLVGGTLRTARVLSDGMLGLCPGRAQAGGADEALTEWMHRMVRELAGSDVGDDSPITFGDLWDAPTYTDEPPGDRQLNLQIITTDVSHSTPRTVPFSQGGLFFRTDEFRLIFSDAMVEWLAQAAPSTHRADGHTFYELPHPRDFPIVVAARLSLSFPLLISAVPLHEVDYGAGAFDPADASDGPVAEAQRSVRFAEEMDELAAPARGNAAGRPMRRCWFTDGGVSSNFPLHLFDAPLPRWPTFAIDLLKPEKGVGATPIFLPKNNNQGLRPGYRMISGHGPARDVLRFLTGIFETMQSWRDLLQGRAPGYRDRIVRVSLGPAEGGMNMDMSQSMLDCLGCRGAEAGRLLVEKFDFENHFWVRHRTSASAVERFVIDYARGMSPPPPGAKAAWTRMWDPARGHTGPYRFNTAQSHVSVRRLELLQSLGHRWEEAGSDLTTGAPKPLQQLRVVPTF